MIRLTPVVKKLLIVNVAIWVLLSLFGRGMLGNNLMYFYLLKSDLILNRGDLAGFHPVQLVTYFFNHDPHSIFHILFNMLILAFFGPAIEDRWGAKPFLRFYLFCGVVGGVLVAFFDPAPNPVIGASGAIMGLLFAFAQMAPNQRIGIMFLPISFKAKDYVLGIGVISVIFIYLDVMGISKGGNISHFGHLAGMVAAMIFYQAARYFPILMQR